MTHKPGWALAFLFSFGTLFTISFLAPKLSAQVDTIAIPAGTLEAVKRDLLMRATPSRQRETG